jgi:cystathionine gamma-synthase
MAAPPRHPLPLDALGTSTAALHADAQHAWAFSTDADVSPPLSMTTTFHCPPEGGEGHCYARCSNPTRDRAEALLGAIEATPGSEAHAILYASGLAAAFAALSALLPRRVAISGGYHGTHLVLAQLRRLSDGARFETIPLPPPADAAAHLREGDLLWLETPRNPDCHVCDIAAYVEAARAVGGVRVVVDGTFGPPPIQRPLAFGVDVVMHSSTKYLSGHSDAMGGALCVGDALLAQQLRDERTAMGSTPGGLESWLLLRSLRTLHLRVTRQCDSAAALAHWLQAAVVTGGGGSNHPLSGKVLSVAHPSLESDPSHAVAKRQMKGGFGGCFALELSTEAAARALPSALSLFSDATSLGGVESLVEWRRKCVRLSAHALLYCAPCSPPFPSLPLALSTSHALLLSLSPSLSLSLSL